MALGRLEMLTESYEGSDLAMADRMASRLVRGTKLDVIHELELRGELPAQEAESLREQLEAEQPMEEVKSP